ncbi:hypothetical protein HMI56_000686 [Coelomomyces lativittatus]|nr:hypothetical protein HMI56_000686 [Coelomomyces lativittatus]
MCLVLLPRNHLQWRVTTTRRLHYVSSITLVHPPHRNLDSSYHTPARTSSSIVPSSPHPYPWDKEGFSFSSPHPSSSSSSSANRKPCLKKWKTILSKNFKYETLQMPSGPLPQLKHGLDRVLFK